MMGNSSNYANLQDFSKDCNLGTAFTQMEPHKEHKHRSCIQNSNFSLNSCNTLSLITREHILYKIKRININHVVDLETNSTI